jgi:uncharacterized protein YhaN
MLWILPVWLVSLIIAFAAGYYLRGLLKTIEHLQEVVQSKVDKQPVEDEPKSMLIDELDPVQVALAEQKRIMQELNPR